MPRQSNIAREGRERVVIEGVTPEIDGGQFAIKRIRGEPVVVEADVFVDGHEVICCALIFRRQSESDWREATMEALANDRWRGSFVAAELGRYVYTITAWVDRFKSWRRDLEKKAKAGTHTDLDLLSGALLVGAAAKRAAGGDAKTFKYWIDGLNDKKRDLSEKLDLALSDELARLVEQYPDRRFATTYQKNLTVVVDREKARFSSWYEMFPRSCAAEPGRHGTFKDCKRLLPYVASMGFDVLYLPPVHPIGRTHRKGKNNTVISSANDPGSPWAIGAQEGGHKSLHPQLGTLADFNSLVKKAESLGIEIALDVAYQCSPDHPYVKEHPEWFRRRPDGSVQYAENPPKKYEDIFPLDFTSEQWGGLWQELISIVHFWMEQGVRIFRVDNPHTKPLPFWQWLIYEVKKKNPEVIFLAEAFTRPKVMYRLAKLGFSQSYTYFAWRNTKPELTQYFTELTQTQTREYFRPSLWPNTPDILNEYLQFSGRPAFMVRLVLAATLGASFGIYGPAFELLEDRPREPGSEEYLNSEKYEIRHWDRERSDSLKELIARVNLIRKENPALQSDQSLRFHKVDNEQIICYTKQSEDLSNVIAVVVNLDPHHVQSGWVTIPVETLQLDPLDSYQAHDLLSGARFLWHGAKNYVELAPQSTPVHILRLRRRIRREQDFDYFL
ncbi:MAG TPA: alpha-1,4-glucan--maltose-1-phosphate maltosyltransferase [Candidatus Binatia bacterium]|nr:alpha-1,4-glucan--maltose-1-phosphate maltosyltransferase [Candidatus Binatia bacterium]